MLQTMSRKWWLIALRGVSAVLFGILAFVWPQLTLGVLILLFAGYALIDGVMSIGASVGERKINDRWWVGLIEGVLSITAAVLAIIWPGITAVVLLYLIAAWAIITGIFEIIAAVNLRKVIEGEWTLALAGVVSIILGLILFFNPGPGILALIWVIGIYAVLFGVLLIYLGFRVRNLSESDSTGTSGRISHA